MIGYKLTIEQRNILEGQLFEPDSFFNPVPDINGDYFISEQEVNNCINPEFDWVKNLEPSEYIPPIPPKPTV